MGSKHLNEVQKRSIRNYKVNNPTLTLADIARVFNVGTSTVARIVGMKTRDPKEKPEPSYYRLCNAQVERMVYLKTRCQYSVTAIALTYGVHRTTVHRALKRYARGNQCPEKEA